MPVDGVGKTVATNKGTVKWTFQDDAENVQLRHPRGVLSPNFERAALLTTILVEHGQTKRWIVARCVATGQRLLCIGLERRKEQEDRPHSSH